MVKKALIVCFFLFFFVLNTFSYAETGYGIIKGRASLRGEVFSGISILVFKEKDIIDLEKPDLVPAQTNIDGSYEFKLPVGKYYLVALKKSKSSNNYKPEEGDLYCFYSGSPVEVVDNGITYVGFNLIKIGKSKNGKKSPGNSGIFGRIFFEGKNLPKSYVYVYKDFKGGFRGPAYIVYPSFDGTFSINLPPGKYYVLARKRMKGGMYGPVEEGDLFNFYYKNPVEVKKGFMHYVEIECVKRLSQLEADEGYPVIEGSVKDKTNKPISGIFVMLYHSKNVQGKPLYISSKTGTNGEFHIKVPPGKYFVMARENIGGPPVSGEWIGRYGEDILIDKNTKITISVEKVK